MIFSGRNQGIAKRRRTALGRPPGKALPALHLLEDRTLLSFSAPMTYPVGEVPWSVAVADFNGDGKLDLVAANLGKYPVDPGAAVSVLLGNGDGTFTSEARYSTGRNPYAVAVGDFNGDGIPDLAVANYFGGSVSVLLGVGDGTFKPNVDYAVGSLPRAVAVGDLNGDGVPDLVVANYIDSTLSVLLGNGDGTFAPALTVPVDSSPAAVAVADLNGDGFGDVVIANDNNSMVEALLGQGDGTFQPPVRYAVGQTPRSLAVADFNGDGIPDLVTANQDSNTVSVLLGVGDGTFQNATDFPVGPGPLSVAVGDINQDGVPDLVVANTYSNTVSILLGQGDGTFQDPLSFEAGAYPASVAVGDFNGDGYPDVAVAQALDPSGMVGVLLNQGDWSAQPGRHAPPAKPPGHQPPPPKGRPANVLVNNPDEDGTSRQDTQSETTLALAGSDVLVAYQDSFTLNLNPPQFTGFSRSTNGGQSFTDGGSLPRNTYGDLGDPVLAHDDLTGRTYLATLSAGPLNVWYSDDDLQTFSGPVNGAPNRGSVFKVWMAVDNFAGPGRGNVYVATTSMGNPYSINLFRSTDRGGTFGPAGGVSIVTATGSGNVQGGWVVVGPDHAVYVFWLDATSLPQTIKMRKSTDQGQTFGPAVTVTTLRTTGASGDLGLGGFRSNALPQAVVNPFNNQIYLVYDDKGGGADRADVYFQQSDDGGATWSTPVSVVDDTTGHDQWQPAVAVTPDGSRVGIFWYDRRLDPANFLIDRFGTIGVVGADGVTFGANFRITDTSFPPEFGHDPVVPPNYMGDYDQAAADDQYFYVTWGDNRLPSRGHPGNNADVRFARVPVELAVVSAVAVDVSGVMVGQLMPLRVVSRGPLDPGSPDPVSGAASSDDAVVRAALLLERSGGGTGGRLPLPSTLPRTKTFHSAWIGWDKPLSLPEWPSIFPD